MSEEAITFSELLEIEVEHDLKEFAKTNYARAMTKEVMAEIRETVRKSVSRCFLTMNYRLSENALTWVTDQYFKLVNVNSSATIGDVVFIHEWRLSELQTSDIMTLKHAFMGSQVVFTDEIEAESLKRVLS